MANQPLLRPAPEPAVRDRQGAKQSSQAEEAMTPKGTLTILLMYAGLIVLMWGYMFLSMLARR